MTEWWNSVPQNQKVYWTLAFPFTALFIFQTIMTFLGLGSGGNITDMDFDGDVDLDLDIDGDSISSNSGIPVDLTGIEEASRYTLQDSAATFKLLTVRNFIIFFVIFSWTGIVASNKNFSQISVLLISCLSGAIMSIITSSIYYFFTNCTESGTLNLRNAVNSVGEVYLAIPEGRKDKGKVVITIQGASRNLDAITDGETLPHGTKVVVIQIVDDQYLLVEKYES